MINSLEDAIKHCSEVAEEHENFENFKCEYCKLGREDGVWKDTCRLPSNIPEGCSWGECSESNCPLFSKCLECAKDHRQLAEWLKKLQVYEEFADWLVKAVLEDGWEESADFYAEVLCRKLTKLGKLKVVDNKYMEVNADEDSD